MNSPATVIPLKETTKAWGQDANITFGSGYEVLPQGYQRIVITPNTDIATLGLDAENTEYVTRMRNRGMGVNLDIRVDWFKQPILGFPMWMWFLGTIGVLYNTRKYYL